MHSTLYMNLTNVLVKLWFSTVIKRLLRPSVIRNIGDFMSYYYYDPQLIYLCNTKHDLTIIIFVS